MAFLRLESDNPNFSFETAMKILFGKFFANS